MSQQYNQTQRNYSPLPRTDSPHHGPPNPYPPIKRQPLSPNPQSPYGSPGVNNIALPNQVFSSPYYGSQTNDASANHTYNLYQPRGNVASPPNHQSHNTGNQTSSPYSPNTNYNPYASSNSPNMTNAYSSINAPPPQPATSSGIMGPPSRPAVDKPTDISELGDASAAAGIDLKEEEAAMDNYYKNRQQRQDGGYGANFTGSFNTHGSTYTPIKDNYYSQNVPGDRSSFYGAGTFNQRAEPPKSTEQLAAELRKKQQRRKAETTSYHLNNPFIAPKPLMTLIAKQTRSAGVTVRTQGLLHSQSRPDAPPRELIVQGPDKNEVLKLVTSEALISTDSPYVEILNLLSLATEERLRGLVEDAATLAKGRRVGSHGIVPTDLTDLATDTGALEAVAGLPTPTNSAVSLKSNPLKRSYSEMNKPLSPVSANDRHQLRKMVSANPAAESLNNMVQAERKWEEERLAKRQRRSAAEGSRAGSSTVGITGSPGEIAPEVDVKKSGKGQREAAAKKATEAQQHAATTKTMNMALGGALGKKLPSWMSKGADTGPSNPFLPKAPIAIASSSKATTTGANGNGSSLPKNRTFGESREDCEAGADIQLRDLISALEHDGKEKKTLQRAYFSQGQAGPRR